MNKINELMLLYKVDNSFYHLFLEAFTHKTYSNEYPKSKNNERLEFLGDAANKLILSRILYDLYPNESEGRLTVLRASLESDKANANHARDLKLDKLLLLGIGEDRNNGRDNDSNLAGTFEAFIGSLYISKGFTFLYSFLSDFYLERIKKVDLDDCDYKSKFQVLMQKTIGTPLYNEIEKTGPAHDPTYLVEVIVDNKIYGVGRGKNKQSAEQNAAKNALEKMEK